MSYLSYLSNTKIAKKYQVSDPTVGKWIKYAQQGKNSLELKKVGNKNYIADSNSNHQLLQVLSEKGAKYKNKIGYERVTPDPQIFEIFSESQLIELIINLKKKILPITYLFAYLFDREGIDQWKNFIDSDKYNERGGVTKTIDSSLDYLSGRLDRYNTVNIINLIPENNAPAKNIIQSLLLKGKKVNYYILHTSSGMIEYLQEDFSVISPDIKPTIQRIESLEYLILRDLLYKNKNNLQDNACNLVLLLECTLGNYLARDQILHNISSSMTKDDYLLLDVGVKSSGNFELVNRFLNEESFIEVDTRALSKLGISKSCYDVSSKHVDKLGCQAHVFTLTKNVDIKINHGVIDDVVKYARGDEIVGTMIYSFELNEIISQLSSCDFNISYFSVEPERSEALIMCEVLGLNK